jgi:hypothetical protein
MSPKGVIACVPRLRPHGSFHRMQTFTISARNHWGRRKGAPQTWDLICVKSLCNFLKEKCGSFVSITYLSLEFA